MGRIMPETTLPTISLANADTTPLSPLLNATLEAQALDDPTIELADGRTFAVLPGNVQLREISDPDRLPSVATARLVVDEAQALIDYVNRFSTTGTVLIADVDTGTVNAVVDYHEASTGGGEQREPGKPKHLRHQAMLVLRPSEEFKRWNAFEGDMHRQDEFAAFLEENAADVIDPESAVLLEVSRDLEATQNVNFKSSVRLESGDRSFTYEDETQVKSNLVVPRTFDLQIPLFSGEEAVILRAALRFRVTKEGLLLGFEWRRVEYLRLATFKEIATRAAEGTGAPMFMGRSSNR